MSFFDLDSYPADREDYFASSVLPCLWFQGTLGPVCGCSDITSDGQFSYSSCHMDDSINNPDCDKGHCPSGSGSTGGNGIEDLPFHDIDDWISNNDDESSGGNSSTGGTNNNNNNNDPKPP